jgi:hypothetical protein
MSPKPVSAVKIFNSSSPSDAEYVLVLAFRARANVRPAHIAERQP